MQMSSWGDDVSGDVEERGGVLKFQLHIFPSTCKEDVARIFLVAKIDEKKLNFFDGR